MHQRLTQTAQHPGPLLYIIIIIIIYYSAVQLHSLCTVQYTIHQLQNHTTTLQIKNMYEISTISALTTAYIEIYTTAHSDHQQHNSIWKTVNIHVTVLRNCLI